MDFRRTVLAGVVAGALTALVSPVPASAAGSAAPTGPDGLGFSVAGSPGPEGSLAGLNLTVTNTSDTTCGLAALPDGTVSILSMRRDGEELKPEIGQSTYYGGIGAAIAASVAPVEPGGAVDLTLPSLRGPDGATYLRTVTPMPDGSGVDALWPVNEPGRYTATAAYVVPALRAEVQACPGATEAVALEFTVGEPPAQRGQWPIVGAVALVLVAMLLVVLLSLRRRRRRTRTGIAAAAVLTVALASVVALPAREAHADIVIDPDGGGQVPADVDFSAAVSRCLTDFDSPGGDPAGIMPVLRDPAAPRVIILPSIFEHVSMAAYWPVGRIRAVLVYLVTRAPGYSYGAPFSPCATLYHELFHAADVIQGTVDYRQCDGTGIGINEVTASFAENAYRRARPTELTFDDDGNVVPDQSTHYDGFRLPASIDDCYPPGTTPPPGGGGGAPGTGSGGEEGTGGETGGGGNRPGGSDIFCGEPNGCGHTHGDPHLSTFDGYAYDFQAVGEFVLVRSTDDDLEVQVRQAPLGTQRSFSINTAVAFRVAGHTVSLTTANGLPLVHLDGAPLRLDRGERDLPGGGSLIRRAPRTGGPDSYEVHWPDGSAVAVDGAGRLGFRVVVRLSSDRAGAVTGLLGDFDGEPTNDLATPAGQAPTQLYPSYADSWRVTGETSLFSYASGESTETFTDRTFPDDPLTLVDIDEDRRRVAESVCRQAGVVTTAGLDECVFDVALSGRAEFAVAGADTEVFARAQPIPAAIDPCLVGTWRELYYRTAIDLSARGGPAARLEGAGRTLTFHADGTEVVDYGDGVTLRGIDADGVEVTLTFTGSVRFLTSTDDGLLSFELVSDESALDLRWGGQPVAVSARAGSDPVDYHCEGGTMTQSQGQYEAGYERVAP